jgi:hypothetical protein
MKSIQEDLVVYKSIWGDPVLKSFRGDPVVYKSIRGDPVVNSDPGAAARAIFRK